MDGKDGLGGAKAPIPYYFSILISTISYLKKGKAMFYNMPFS